MRDLMIVSDINCRINEKLPVYFNNLLYGGYINMPSARMGQEGEIGAGYTYLHPYRLWNLRCQLTDRLEISGNYRIYTGVDDAVLTDYGFGDYSDKGANIKLAVFHPEDSGYELPGLAFGTEDFIGTKSFNAQYIVLTQVILNADLEFTLGYGWNRIRGLFGGYRWMPFRRWGLPWLKDLTITGEYDATPYRDKVYEPHPEGRERKTHFNMGLNWRLFDQFDFSLSYIRGVEWSASISNYYNFGTTKGFLPKIDDSLPYNAPVNLQPLGELRPEPVMIHDLIYAFGEQDLRILDAWLSYNECGKKVLRIKILNIKYRLECQVRNRLNHLLAGLIPLDIDAVIVTMEGDGFPLQEYYFTMEIVREYGDRQIGDHELNVLTPLREATWPEPCYDYHLFQQRHAWWEFDVFPKVSTYFGSSSGKFKYALGASTAFTGFIQDDLYYSLELGYIAFANNETVGDMDRLNPSRIINVRSDIVRYYQQKGVTVDQAYIQKNWNLGKGWFSRVALGYFEVEYGGAVAEFLYYPVNSNWAIGFEGAILKKRELNSWFGFTNKIRKIRGWQPEYVKFTGSQYFIDLYYEWAAAKIDFKIKAGKFLANDWGARFEASRYFPSGLRITLWYTATNGNDIINGQIYHDKGASFSMPLDIFYTHSDVNRWGYGMSAWLRDVGVTSFNGQELYEMINDARQ